MPSLPKWGHRLLARSPLFASARRAGLQNKISPVSSRLRKRSSVSLSPYNGVPTSCLNLYKNSCLYENLASIFKELSFMALPIPQVSSRAAVESNRSCDICKKEVAKIYSCSLCRLKNYCGKECQKDDWIKHKVDCFPNDWVFTTLTSNIEIKRLWLYGEWDSRNTGIGNAQTIKKEFPSQEALHPVTGNASEKAVSELFYKVRGKYSPIWGQERENAMWQKISIESLDIDWVKTHIFRPWPSTEKFEISRLDGLVLWKDISCKTYRLLEGNHRVSAWLLAGTPKTLPATIYIGSPK